LSHPIRFRRRANQVIVFVSTLRLLASQIYQNRVRQNVDLSSRFKLILAVQPRAQKYSA
jgi:hypothetical protein